MKKSILLIVIIVNSYSVLSQEKEITIDETVTGTQTVTARDKVILAPGFSYIPGTGETFIANIDKSLICDIDYLTGSSIPDPDDKEINTNKPVGATAGSFNVTPMGAATYTIPIYTSPGTSGMVPRISVSYNSRSGNGILGFGWNLSGLSTITRIVKPYYMEDEVNGINMDGNDMFGLDGNPLIIASGTYGGDNATYKTESETFVTVTSHGTTGPDWFEVELRNGSKMEYGHSNYSTVEDGSSNALIWNITKIEDVNGNYIEYNYDYDSDTDQTYLKSIEYTGNDGTSLEPYNEIVFRYEDREDINEAYYLGVNVPQRLVINKIESYCEGELVREYTFSYKKDYYTQLVEVQELAGDGTSLNSTTFEWGAEEDDKYRFVNAGSIPSTENRLYSGDFNGDGKADYVVMEDKETYYSTDKWYLYLYDYPSDEYLVTDSGFIEAYHFFQTDTGFFDSYFKGITVFDYDSDGDDDMFWEYDQLVTYDCNCAPCTKSGSSSSLSSDTLDKEITTLFIPPPQDTCCETCFEDRQLFKYIELMNDTLHSIESRDLLYYTSDNLDMIPADFDGDGKPDIMVIEADDKSVCDFEDIYVSTYPNFGSVSNILILDFNGDGKSDILTYSNISGYIDVFEFNDEDNDFDQIISNYYSTYHDQILPGDFNGDGKTDLLTRDDNPIDSTRTRILYSKGNGFESKQGPISEYIKTGPPHGGVPVTYIDEVYLDFITQDFNGDGKTDILKSFNYVEVYKDEQANEYYSLYTKDEILVSTGLGFSTDEIFFGEEGKRYFKALDNNFDGNNDILITLKNSGDKVLEFFPDNRRTNVLSITNGFNIKQEIQYEPITDSRVYTSESESYTLPIKPVIFPMKVVYLTKTFDNNTSSIISKTKYQYSNQKLHIEGKGLLGFSKTFIRDSISTDSIVTVFDYDNTLYKPYVAERYAYRNDQLLSTTDNTQYIHSLDNGSRFFSYISSSQTEDELNNVIKEIAKTVTSSGNMTARTTKYMDDQENETSRIVESYSNFNSYGLPADATLTSTRDQSSIIREKSFLYFSNGLLKKEIKDYDTAGSLETSYTYDSFGNPLTISVSNGSETKTTTMTYENSKARFILTSTEPLNFTTSYTFDEATGNILTEKDHNDLEVSYSYDVFGKVTQIELPTGQVITNTIDWSEGSENVEDVYYTLTETTGKPDVKVFYDVLAREVRTKTEGFDGTMLITDKKYDSEGRLNKSYNPYFSGTSANQYVDLSYDNLGRLSTETVYPQNVTTSYSYSALEKTTTKGGRSYTQEMDESGLLIEVTEPGGTITYNYNPEGQISSIISPSGTTTITYDDFGFQDELQDIDAGTIDYDYNIFGELIKQTDAKGNIVEIDYDAGGRITEKDWTGGQTITYNYNATTGLLTSIESTNGTEHSFTYDNYSRLLTKTEEIDPSNIYTAEYTYNTSGEIGSMEVNDDITISYDYNNYGYMDQVDLTTSSGITTIWEANEVNKHGVYSDYDLGNGNNTSLTFDQYGYLDKIETVNGSTYIQDWDYDFNTTFGNMTSREGLTSSTTYEEETFTYDSQNRLEDYTINQNTMSLSYDSNGKGNILTKTDVGTYTYDYSNPHQLDEITNPTSLMQGLPDQDITYTKFNKTSTISITDTGLDKDLSITYGPDQLRVKTVFEDNSSTVLTKYFALGMYEKEVHATDGTRELYYINTPSEISAILESTSTYDSIFYIHTDILGSYDVITNDQGGVRERLSFDPWGRRRNPSDWSFNSVPTSYKFDRGFTGHEHLDDFDLINMNGRMYDPILALFSSPDIFIQSAKQTQSFNRYSYVLNKPLKYIDPSGYKVYAVPEIGEGVYYDDVEDRYIYYSDIIGREARYFGYGFSAITTMPGYRSGGAIYKVDSYGNVEFGYYTDVSFSTYGSRNTNNRYHIGEVLVLATRPMWIQIGTSNIAANSGGVDGLDNILFAVSMGNQGGDKAVQYFQMSNKGILRAAVNNHIPTDRIKGIMRSTGKVGTGLKVVGVLGNVASAGHTMYKISQDGMSVQYGADLVFNGIAFVPGWGWVVSGVYFGGQAIMESEGFKAMQQEWREKYPITGAPPHMIGHCFVEGTQVLMKDFSLCNIENIEVGDTVKTFNFRTSELENNRVLKISAPIHNDLVTISFTNDIKNINTEDHPYYVKGKGWCSFKPELTFQRYGLEALQLKEGDICFYYKDGELLEIKIVEIISLDIEVKTYNLTEIENSNNYFANGFLVYNESENLKNTSKVPLNKNGQKVMFKPLEIK